MSRTIEILEKCEDSHSYSELVDGEVVVKSDVRVFRAGEVHNGEGIPGDWERRCDNLIGLKLARQL